MVTDFVCIVVFYFPPFQIMCNIDCYIGSDHNEGLEDQFRHRIRDVVEDAIERSINSAITQRMFQEVNLLSKPS